MKIVLGKGIVAAVLVAIYSTLLHREVSDVLASTTEQERVGNLMIASGVGLLATFVLSMATIWIFSGPSRKDEKKDEKEDSWDSA